MQLDHERLDVYDLALEFLVLANGIVEGLPRGRSHLADQFTRASLSIVLNLAEGAGKHSKLLLPRLRADGHDRRACAPGLSGASNTRLPNSTSPVGPPGTGTGTVRRKLRDRPRAC